MLTGVIFQAIILLCSKTDGCRLSVSTQPLQSEMVCEKVLSDSLLATDLDKALAAGYSIHAKCVALAKPFVPYEDPDRDGRVASKVLNIDPPEQHAHANPPPDQGE